MATGPISIVTTVARSQTSAVSRTARCSFPRNETAANHQHYSCRSQLCSSQQHVRCVNATVSRAGRIITSRVVTRLPENPCRVRCGSSVRIEICVCWYMGYRRLVLGAVFIDRSHTRHASHFFVLLWTLDSGVLFINANLSAMQGRHFVQARSSG